MRDVRRRGGYLVAGFIALANLVFGALYMYSLGVFNEGGGSYTASMRYLVPTLSLIVAVTLIQDYTLTIVVSALSGGDQLLSILGWYGRYWWLHFLLGAMLASITWYLTIRGRGESARVVFALLGVLGFVSYALSGWKQWGWLFPTGVFGGLAVTTALAISKVDSAAIASPLFLGLLVPFVVAYFKDRSHNWWALIPGGIMLFLVLVTLTVDSAGGEWVGSLFLFMIALGFLAVYLNKRSRTWALLVAYIVGVLGIAPAMGSNQSLAPYNGPGFLLAVALPFFLLYFQSADRWWAIIPAGAMTLLSIITVAGIAGWIRTEGQGGYISALLMGGLAACFAVIWLRHAKPWAKVVTIVLTALAVASALFAAQSAVLWPVAIILVGLYLLFISMRRKAA